MNRAEYLRMHAVEAEMWWYRGLHATLLCLIDRTGIGPAARALDAGCGTGGMLKRLHERLPSLRAVGLDIDHQAVDLAREKSAAPVCVGSISALPVRPDAFDLILSADVLCHRAVDEAAALAGFNRALRPGGALLLSLPAYDWLYAAHDRAVHTSRRYTAARLRGALVGAGFTTINTGYWNMLPFPLMVIHRKLLARNGARSDVAAFPPMADALLRFAMTVETLMLRARLRLPFGGSVWAVARK